MFTAKTKTMSSLHESGDDLGLCYSHRATRLSPYRMFHLHLGRNVRKQICWRWTNEYSNRMAHPRSLIRVFVVRMKKLRILANQKCSRRRFWSDCAVWSESLLGAHVRRYWLWCYGTCYSFHFSFADNNYIINVTGYGEEAFSLSFKVLYQKSLRDFHHAFTTYPALHTL